MLELEVGGVWGRETFVYELRFLRLPLAKQFPLQLRIAHMAWGGKCHCQQPVPDSFRKPQASRS